MRMNALKKFVSTVIVVTLIAVCPLATFAHSGRTDSSGGHRDNKNASGLGSYHYHHGYGPHLHTGGVCPYNASTTTPQTKPAATTVVKAATTALTKPAFPVVINDQYLNVATSPYYPVVINGITYIPLSAEVIAALNLSGGWIDSYSGIVLKSKPSAQSPSIQNPEASFFHQYAVSSVKIQHIIIDMTVPCMITIISI